VNPHVDFHALAPELAPDYDQRTSLMAFRWFFAIGAIADANGLQSPGMRLNIIVLAANGEHAAATTKRNVRYAYQTVRMARPAVRPRIVVRQRSA